MRLEEGGNAYIYVAGIDVIRTFHSWYRLQFHSVVITFEGKWLINLCGELISNN